MLLPVEINDIWLYPKTGTRYKVEGLPTVRNAIYDCEVNHSGMSREPKWVPGVRYVSMDAKDLVGTGDNQEFIRTRDDFQETYDACWDCGGMGEVPTAGHDCTIVCKKCKRNWE